MADERNEDAPEDQASEVIAHIDDKDWFLQQVIGMADLGLSFGLTLTVGGTVISGTLISGKVYFEELGELIKGGTTNLGDKTLNMIGDTWKELSQLYVKPEDAGEDWQKPITTYVHLNNAKLYAPGQPTLPTGKGLLWRGKLSAVSGFSLGSFGESN